MGGSSCDQKVDKLSSVQIVELSCKIDVSFYRPQMKPYFRGTKNAQRLRSSNSDLYKQLSSSVENYAWERFRVLHSDFYLYSKTGNLFVL